MEQRYSSYKSNTDTDANPNTDANPDTDTDSNSNTDSNTNSIAFKFTTISRSSPYSKFRQSFKGGGYPKNL